MLGKTFIGEFQLVVEVGEKAPELGALNNEKQPIRLQALIGKPTVLVFPPGAFTGGCQQNAFIEENELNFPFLSDYTRQTIESYGVAIQNFAGMAGYTSSSRSIFLLDSTGKIRFKSSVPPTEQPNLDELKNAIEALG